MIAMNLIQVDVEIYIGAHALIVMLCQLVEAKCCRECANLLDDKLGVVKCITEHGEFETFPAGTTTSARRRYLRQRDVISTSEIRVVSTSGTDVITTSRYDVILTSSQHRTGVCTTFTFQKYAARSFRKLNDETSIHGRTNSKPAPLPLL